MMYSAFDMDDTVYSDGSSSSYSFCNSTSSNSPFDGGATIRCLPSKLYFDVNGKFDNQSNKWLGAPQDVDHMSYPLNGVTEGLTVDMNNVDISINNNIWSSTCLSPRATTDTSGLEQHVSDSGNLAFWSSSQDGVLVREIDPELFQLGSDYGQIDEMEEQSIYMHPKFAYPQPLNDYDNQSLMTTYSRRMSDASASIDNDVVSYDSYTAGSDALLPPSDTNSTGQHAIPSSFSSISTTELSPLHSPRLGDLLRTPSRPKASPSPRQTSRLTPYSIETRNKRWSTGSYLPNNQSFLGFNYCNPSIASTLDINNVVTGLATCPESLSGCSDVHCDAKQFMNASSTYNVLPKSRPASYYPPRPFLESQTDQSLSALQLPYLRMLQSNVDAQYHYGDLSDPPALYASLAEEQLNPPEEDMNPEDPDMKPHEQELRFDGDLYTPKWVRNHGNKREGWCGICKPGRWLVLKNSAFWYDKSFTHGISAATGQAFMEPQDIRRMDGNPDVWEGLCHSCHDWISLVSNKKKGTTWFRHAYKCHVHQAPKIKGVPKKRIRDPRPSTSRSTE